MSELSREHFVRLVVEHVKVKFPLVQIAPGNTPFTMRVNGRTRELEDLYRLSLLRPAERLHQIDRWMVELLRAYEGTPDAMGTLKQLRNRILPMVVPADSTHAANGTVCVNFLERLQVAYAIDQDRTILYLPRERFDEWDLTTDELHALALQNLLERSEKVAAQAAKDENGNVNLVLISTLDGYDASRILLPTLHDWLRPYLGSPFGAAIPNRDMLLCFRNDDETVGRLKTQVADDFRQMPHSVTDQLLLVTPDGIAPRAE